MALKDWGTLREYREILGESKGGRRPSEHRETIGDLSITGRGFEAHKHTLSLKKERWNR